MNDTIRVKKSVEGSWQVVKLLESGKYGSMYMVQVDDGQGPLWLMAKYVHPEDRARLFSHKTMTKPLNDSDDSSKE